MSLVNYGYSDDDDDVISETLPSESNEKKSINSLTEIKPTLSSSLSSLTFKTKSNSRIQIKAFDDDLANGKDEDDSDEEDDDNRARKRMKRSEKGSSLIS
ncbi:hypothetical protein BLA29_011349, partial [Euroglyphus maynei]